MIIAPPTDPGMQDKNSKFPMLFSVAKLATLRSKENALASIICSLINCVYEKLRP